MGKPKRVIDVDVYDEEKKDSVENNEERPERRSERRPEERTERRPERRHDERADRRSEERSERRPERRHEERPERKSERRSERRRDNNSANSNSNGKFDFNNIDFGQIAGLLQNVDLNQISSLLGGLGGSSGGGQGLLGSISKMMGGAAAPQGNPAPSASIPYRGDRRLEVLNAIKPMVAPERAALIDMIMQIYVISKILRG